MYHTKIGNLVDKETSSGLPGWPYRSSYNHIVYALAGLPKLYSSPLIGKVVVEICVRNWLDVWVYEAQNFSMVFLNSSLLQIGCLQLI